MKKTLTTSAAVIAAAIALAGCSAGPGTGSSDTSSMPGMNRGSSGTSSSSAPAASGDSAWPMNDDDTMFAQMMIPHHAQAMEMSDIMLAKDGLDPQIIQLAEDIKAAQGPEIEKMTGWLQAWGEPMEMSGDHAMEGMMSPDDLEALESAQGDDAARMFLTQMIAHHEGAVAMAEEESANGQNADTVALAETVIADQSAEIEKMKDLQANL